MIPCKPFPGLRECLAVLISRTPRTLLTTSIAIFFPLFLQAKPEPRAKKAFDYFPYFAYSPNGTVEGELVFIKAGSEDDINLLLNRTNVSLTNKIVIARGIYARVSTRKLYFKQAVMVHDPM